MKINVELVTECLHAIRNPYHIITVYNHIKLLQNFFYIEDFTFPEFSAIYITAIKQYSKEH